ncbi:MAG TPA: hypothetical protein VFW60_06610 [Rhodanobacteraceae bacterium]|nr:hypothetical protein [Rhodanobacteraceae bacterium]
MRRVVEVGVVLLVAVVAALWVIGQGQHQLGHVGIAIHGPKSLPGPPLLGLLDTSAVLLVLLYGLWRLRSLLRCFEQGDFFGLAPVLHLRAFALTLVLAAVFDVLLPPLLELGARFAGASGIAGVSAEMDGSDGWLLLTGGLFYLIGWILTEARRAAEDSAQII